ncbi:hypothetical protein [Cellulomonas sp.]|uniref:hypothetical protein n=1 Tax=Cellulomonas sp. TaxID=40001 RepID=UPI003BAD2363
MPDAREPLPTVRATPPTADRARLLASWALAADAIDELELAAALMDEAGLPATETASRRAGIAYLRGTPQETVRILGELGMTAVPAEGPQRIEHVLLLGAQAATGDHPAFARLVALGGSIPAEHRAWFLYVLAVAAERCGRLEIADDAWRSLAVDVGVSSSLVLSRFLSGWVAGRDTRDADRAMSQVLQAAQALRSASPRPWQDASTMRRTVEALDLRGDSAGAALLTAAVGRTSPPDPRLAELAACYRPEVRRAPVVVPVVVAAVATLVAAVPGLAAGVALVIMLRSRWRAVPSLSMTDERVWFGLGAMRFDARKVQEGASQQVRSLVVVLVLGGALLAVLASVGLWSAAQEVWPDVPLLVQVAIWLVPVVVLPAVGGALGQWLLRDADLRALRRRDAEHDRQIVAEARRCACWEVASLIGPRADAYVAVHLRPVSGPDMEVSTAGRAATVFACPLSGVRWLATTAESGVSTLLLRGTAAPSAFDGAQQPIGTGGYL